ncbi:hypothetical protein CCHR01_05855 [Colletotrichum chrysophilum]|uniref:Uncharacterized protein n=1 Tax=Colletotrichum chrysophilum TaxID=1836956 RepID=A0AAD9APN4_9PEZI|nr:hypothetical protein CCHR01_05855 [Colletotrichum chrysophilum]
MGAKAASIRDGSLAKDALSYHEDLEEQGYKGDTSSSERRGNNFEIVTRQDPIPLNEWVCGRLTGGGGPVILRQLVDAFKYQFGTQTLVLQKSTCYSSTCCGSFFTVCNEGGSRISVNGDSLYLVSILRLTQIPEMEACACICRYIRNLATTLGVGPQGAI